MVVAMRKGFYKDEGIDVDKVQMQPDPRCQGPDRRRCRLLVGVGLGVARSGYRRADQKRRWHRRAAVACFNRPRRIQNPKELRNKVIGVDSVAGTVDYLSRVAVRHFGMEPDKDVKIIVTGESPTRLAALRSGAIDATPIDVAFAVKAEDEGFQADGLSR